MREALISTTRFARAVWRLKVVRPLRKKAYTTFTPTSRYLEELRQRQTL